ncbi:NAD(P)-binding protein [Xylaria bambusicola]|uniref:NAD(P)-binding protein n=1 Tax=Xylaria bambusicola TaxID=326684 RepID=UPI002007543D|nr:NAD(P)-binding protein [Xylaria bambusicola]KAI0502947.1 NAD(P)-binding protein [Xylaria bambusicola]
MSDQKVVVITGAGRGLGNALARAYLARPNHTVVGSYRNEAQPGVGELKSSPKADGSRLILVKIESSSPSDAAEAVKAMKAEGIEHVDVLIANAGVSPPLQPVETVDLSILKNAFDVNALGPLALYQACHELLKKSSSPKFAPISSAAGTLGGMEKGHTWVAPSYCISKAALNWITLAAHCGNPWLTAIAINPGLIATDMGNETAKYLGLEKAPWTPEQSAEKVMAIIDDSSREKYSGKFIDAISGIEFPW